ncbi:MAG: type B 50S ribosomal protein L31 [Candidatus Magasanikbacteria bacterium]
MKENTHPETHPVIFRDVSNGEEFMTKSTLTSEETKTVDGTEYYVIDIEVSSASHPFYTGEQRFVDTEGQVDKFKAKMEKVKEKKEEREEIEQRQQQKEEKEDKQDEGNDLEDLKDAVSEEETKSKEGSKEEGAKKQTKDIDYKQIVSQNIPEVKSAVQEQDLDTEQVLAAEKDNKDRKTLKSWLKDKSESEN